MGVDPRCSSCNFQIVFYENNYDSAHLRDQIVSSNMIVTTITIASLFSGVLGSHDSLAKCLYEEEVAEAQV